MRRAGTIATLALALLATQGSAAADARSAADRAAPKTARSHRLGQGAGAVRRYWTPQRMRSARPLLPDRSGARAPATASTSGLPAVLSHAAVNRFEIQDTSSYPARVHGSVFLTFPGEGDFECSGTAVGSLAGNVVLSAGHCVYDGGESEQWATNWMFIPGYHNGQSPFGEWVASRVASTPQWVAGGEARFSYDVGGAVMQPIGGTQLEKKVGARGTAFGQPRDQLFRAFGYPAQQPPLEFTGGRLFACDSAYGGDDQLEQDPRPMRIACDLTAGSSGGGWVIHDAFVNSVISYGYVLQPNDIYGPYFGSVAAALYRDVAAVGLCHGAEPTLVGTGASEKLTGTGAADVLLGLGGNDRIEGGGGDDVVCAGSGDDVLDGGPGSDELAGEGGSDSASFGGGHRVKASTRSAHGQGSDRLEGIENLFGSPRGDVLRGDGLRNLLRGRGGPDRLKGRGRRDRLLGGAGRDRCDGGRGRDLAKGCEAARRL